MLDTLANSRQQKSKNKPCSSELLQTFADNVRVLRAEKGWSQERLAEEAGMHRTFISLIERRGRNITLGVVETIASALGVDVPTILSAKTENKH